MIAKSSRATSKRIIVTACLLSVAFAGGTLTNGAQAASESEEYLLRLEVKNPGDETVELSAPLNVLHTFLGLLPQEVKGRTEKAGLNAEEIIEQLKSVEKQDLIRVEGKENVRVWIEQVTRKNRKSAKFIKIHVTNKEKGENINVCLPAGLVQIAGAVVKELGLIEQFVELPPFLTEATKHNGNSQAVSVDN